MNSRLYVKANRRFVEALMLGAIELRKEQFSVVLIHFEPSLPVFSKIESYSDIHIQAREIEADWYTPGGIPLDMSLAGTDGSRGGVVMFPDTVIRNATCDFDDVAVAFRNLKTDEIAYWYYSGRVRATNGTLTIEGIVLG